MLFHVSFYYRGNDKEVCQPDLLLERHYNSKDQAISEIKQELLYKRKGGVSYHATNATIYLGYMSKGERRWKTIKKLTLADCV